MKNKKIVLITIIVLLFIFIPLTVIGYFAKGDNGTIENPNHEFYYHGYLWFYATDGTLINKYECQTNICELAKFSIDDMTYDFDYYKDGTVTEFEYHGSSHVFITDGEKTILYDLNREIVVSEINIIKTYNTDLNNLYIVQTSLGKWGLVRINNVKENGLVIILNFDYDFIGLANKVNDDNSLNTDIFIVKSADNWFLIDAEQNVLSNYIPAPIYDYNDYYIVNKDEYYHIYDYEANTLYSEYQISDYTIEDEYIGLVSKNKLYLYNRNDLLKSYDLTANESNIEFEKSGSSFIIKNNGIIIDNIAIN